MPFRLKPLIDIIGRFFCIPKVTIMHSRKVVSILL